MSPRRWLGVLALLGLSAGASADGARLRAALNRGRAALQAERLAEALTAFDAALALDAGSLEAHVGRVAALRRLGRTEDAERALTAAGARHRQAPALSLEAGKLRLAQRRWADAIGALQRAARHPALAVDGSLWHALGAAHHGAGDDRRAAGALSRAAALSPFDDDVGFHALRGRVWLRLGDWEAARKAYRLGRKHFPESPWMLDGLGWARLYQGHERDAGQLRAEAVRRYWASRRYAQKTTLRLPFDGPWRCLRGAGEPPTHQGLIGHHALDFEIVRNGLPHPEGGASRCSDYYAFGALVRAPAAGTVRSIENTIGDNIPGRVRRQPSAGNHVMIEHEGGEHSFLCHLQQGSVTVKVDQTVDAGAIVGRCGNSGHSGRPHLHLALMRRGAHGWVALPVRYSRYRRVRPRPVAVVGQGTPRRGEIVEPATAR